MYNPNLIPADALEWLTQNAQNELAAYLCEVDFYEMYGNKWPAIARDQATLCRAIAAAATEPIARESWLNLARQYEGTVTSQ